MAQPTGPAGVPHLAKPIVIVALPLVAALFAACPAAAASGPGTDWGSLCTGAGTFPSAQGALHDATEEGLAAVEGLSRVLAAGAAFEVGDQLVEDLGESSTPSPLLPQTYAGLNAALQAMMGSSGPPDAWLLSTTFIVALGTLVGVADLAVEKVEPVFAFTRGVFCP